MLRLFRNPVKPSSSIKLDMLEDYDTTCSETIESVSAYSYTTTPTDNKTCSEQSIEISETPILTRVSSASESSTSTTISQSTSTMSCMSFHSVLSTPSARDSCASSCEEDNDEEDDNATYEQDHDEDVSQATDYEDRDDSTLVVQDQSSLTQAKLSFMLDDVRLLARLGHNAACKNIYKLEKGVSTSDIHVLPTDMDERGRGKSKSKQLEESVQIAITEDLRVVYSASVQDAKFILATVIVLLTDGSLSHTFWDTEGVAGLAEIGLVWRLFEADTLKVYGGGLVVQKKDVGYGIWDVFANKGQLCLLKTLVPRVADGIMSRIGDSNSDLLVEI